MIRLMSPRVAGLALSVGAVALIAGAPSAGASPVGRPTLTSVSCSPSTVSADTSTTCTATVTDNGGDAPSAPGGSATFSSNRPHSSFDGSPCTLLPVDGMSSSCSVTFTAGIATAMVNASYTPSDDVHADSSNSTSVTVTPRSTTTSVDCPNNPVAINEQTTCTITVVDTDSGTSSAPTGTVKMSGNKTDQFLSNPCTLHSFKSTNTSTCDVFYTAEAGPNTHTLTALYQGDSAHKASHGTFSVTVNEFTTG